MATTVIEGYRLSPQQRRLWRLLRSDSPTPYVSQCVLLVRPALDFELLRGALTDLHARVELLRTTLSSVAGMAMPLQVISEKVPRLRLLRECAGETVRCALRVAERERRGASEVEGESPLGVVLVEGEGESALVLTVGALYGDSAGVRNLGRLLARCYAAGVAGEDEEEEEAQYADLSEWQNELMESEATAAGREFWHRARTQDEGETGEGGGLLPWGSRGVGGAVSGVGVLSRELCGEHRVRVTEACAAQGVREGEWLLACWAAQWWRARGGALTIGVRFDGRRYEGLAQSPGLFARYLPVRVALGGGLSAGEAARVAAEMTRELEKWQEYYDGAALSEEDVGYSYDAGDDCWVEGGRSWEVVYGYEWTEPHGVKLACRPRAEGLSVELHYDEGRVTADAAERLLEGYLALVNSASSHPGAGLGRLEVLGEAERRTLLEEWSGACESAESAEGCVHELFERQAALTPDATAVVCGEERMSYRELDERSNRLARRLRASGVGPERPVAVSAERAAQTLVSILAVLKAGGAYVPLDLSSPAERIKYLLEDSGAAVLLGCGESVRGVADKARACVAAVVDLEEFEQSRTDDALDADAEPVAGVEVSPDNLVYVIYTSGSTGRPKGVSVTHRQLLSYVRAADLRIDLLGRSSFAVVSTLAADLAHTMLFPALVSGGCLHLVPTEAASDARLLAEEFAARPVDCLKIVPSHLRALLDGGGGAGVLPRRRLVMGGEALREELFERVCRELEASGSECEVYNHYGPTETTVGAVARKAMAGDGAAESAAAPGVPLGRPLANARVYVLDGEMGPVPVGAAGELYIGGSGVARGYMNRPGLTAERFVPDPFSHEGGARLYRTGDVVRYVDGGELEFVGRADDQVKVRGYRVELGEVESAVRELEGVGECVVVAREDEGGDRRLAAYVVRSPGGDGDEWGAAQWRGSLKGKLPEYMIPASFVVLDRLPLTANGKLDKRALPEPTRDAENGAEYVAPRTPVEEVLCGIWSEVLGVERVGVSDDFFELGGHSLLAMQVVSRIKAAFNVEMRLSTLFDARAVGELSKSVESGIREGRGLSEPEMKRVGRDGELPLSFAQQRLWFFDQLEPGSSFYNIFRGVRLSGVLNVKALEQAYNEIVGRHEVLRTTFEISDSGLPLQRIAGPEPLKLVTEDLSALPAEAQEAEARRLADEESQRAFELSRGPLLRVRLLRRGPEEHVMLLTMHHIVSDGWSMGLLLREFVTLYRAFSSGAASPLAALPIQYADYAVCQREWLRGEVLDAHLSYWKKQLAGAPPLLELPTDRPRPEIQSFEGARHQTTLSRELSEALEALGRREGSTLFITLMSAFQVLLHYLTGREDLVVGTDVANRDRVETESLIGFFINQLALRTNLSGDPSFRGLLGRVREVVWAAHAHQELPFDRLVEALNPERSLKYSPVFQVKLVFQNAQAAGVEQPEDSADALPELRLSGLPVEGVNAKFDLTLNAVRRADSIVYWIEYGTALFNASTVARFAGLFEALLGHVVERPELPLSELEQLLAAAEREQRARRGQELKEARVKKFKSLTRKSADDARQGSENSL